MERSGGGALGESAAVRMRLTFIAGAFALLGATLAAADSLIDDVAGVYRHSFENGDVDGTKYRSENVLEIVKIRPDQAYIRAHLEFYNGHRCSVYGIAKLEGEALTYRTRSYNNSVCVLTLRRRGDRLVFGDNGSACRDKFCGMRGAFEGEGFLLSSRRPIRYMKRLLASREYAEAVAEQSNAK